MEEVLALSSLHHGDTLQGFGPRQLVCLFSADFLVRLSHTFHQNFAILWEAFQLTVKYTTILFNQHAKCESMQLISRASLTGQQHNDSSS